MAEGYLFPFYRDSCQVRQTVEEFSRDFPVIPGFDPVGVDQRRFGALAGDQDEVVGLRDRQRQPDRLSSIGLLVERGAAGLNEVTSDLLDHCDGILGAWILVGDHGVIGVHRGGSGHAGLASRVALTGDAEDKDQTAPDMWLEGLQSDLKGRAGGGGVDDNRELLAFVDRFHAAGDRPQIVQGGLQRNRSEAKAPGSAGGERGVAEVVLAGDRQSRAERSGGSDDSYVGASGVLRAGNDADVGDSVGRCRGDHRLLFVSGLDR